MKRKISFITLFISLFAVIAILIGRGMISGESENNHPAKPGNSPLVRVAPASKATISRSLELTGSVEPYRMARLASPAEGPVVGIQVREGDRVKAGDGLLSMGRKKGVDALIISLRDELKKEEDNLSRTRQLVENGALPGEELDQARSAFEKVRAQLVKAEETAGDYVVTAPWGGIVSRVIVKEGEFVAPRAELLEMYDPTSLVIRAAVPEKHAAEITAGMRVDVTLDAYPDQILHGRIERVYPYLDPRLRTRTMEVALDQLAELLPGMFARLKVRITEINDAVIVPVEALVTTPNGQVIFVVEEGKAFARPVEIGIEEDNHMQIVTGLQSGDMVIIAGNEKLKDGAPVRLYTEDNSGKDENSEDMTKAPARQKKNAGGGGK